MNRSADGIAIDTPVEPIGKELNTALILALGGLAGLTQLGALLLCASLGNAQVG